MNNSGSDPYVYAYGSETLDQSLLKDEPLIKEERDDESSSMHTRSIQPDLVMSNTNPFYMGMNYQDFSNSIIEEGNDSSPQYSNHDSTTPFDYHHHLSQQQHYQHHQQHQQQHLQQPQQQHQERSQNQIKSDPDLTLYQSPVPLPYPTDFRQSSRDFAPNYDEYDHLSFSDYDEFLPSSSAFASSYPSYDFPNMTSSELNTSTSFHSNRSSLPSNASPVSSLSPPVELSASSSSSSSSVSSSSFTSASFATSSSSNVKLELASSSIHPNFIATSAVPAKPIMDTPVLSVARSFPILSIVLNSAEDDKTTTQQPRSSSNVLPRSQSARQSPTIQHDSRLPVFPSQGSHLSTVAPLSAPYPSLLGAPFAASYPNFSASSPRSYLPIPASPSPASPSPSASPLPSPSLIPPSYHYASAPHSPSTLAVQFSTLAASSSSTPTLAVPAHRKRRRKSGDLPETDRWYCPLNCGKFYRRTSTKSIEAHMKNCDRILQYSIANSTFR